MNVSFVLRMRMECGVFRVEENLRIVKILFLFAFCNFLTTKAINISFFLPKFSLLFRFYWKERENTAYTNSRACLHIYATYSTLAQLEKNKIRKEKTEKLEEVENSFMLAEYSKGNVCVYAGKGRGEGGSCTKCSKKKMREEGKRRKQNVIIVWTTSGCKKHWKLLWKIIIRIHIANNIMTYSQFSYRT